MTKNTQKYRITFTEPTLATSPGNPELLQDHIASRAPTEAAKNEEIEAAQIQEEVKKASTVFPKDEKGLFAWDYQLRGYFKEALTALIELGDLKSVSKWAIKGVVDSFVFVSPRRCYYASETGQAIHTPSGVLQRPLRATTLQGDRIALASSEQLPAGTTLSFTLNLLTGDNPKSKKMLTIQNIEDALDYGQFKGFSQWRGAGYGRITWEKIS